MRLLKVEPAIYKYRNCHDFWKEFRIGKDDLIITNKNIYCEFLKDNIKECAVILTENYGTGDLSYEMIESIYESIKKISYERVIAIGDVNILEIGKILSLKNIHPVNDLFELKLEILKEKELVLVPADLGYTGEMNNICILKSTYENSIKELVEDELYADSTILIPELLNLLSFKNFILNSINVFMQAVFLYISPKTSDYIKIMTEKSIRIILNGYKKLECDGTGYYSDLFESFLLASNYVNTSFANFNQSRIEDRNMNFDLCKDGKEYDYFLDFLRNCLITQTNNEIGLSFSDLLSKILECDKNHIYDALAGIIKKIVLEQV